MVKYWYMVLIFGVIIVGAIIGVILTLDWFISTSDVGGGGSWTIADFSMGTAILWVLLLILWEFLIVGLATLAVLGIIVAIAWFRVISSEDKEEIKKRSKESIKKSGGGGAFSFLIFVGLCIYLFIDGNWLTPFGNLPYSYFINAIVVVFVWIVIIFGIPAAIIGIIWFVRKCGKEN